MASPAKKVNRKTKGAAQPLDVAILKSSFEALAPQAEDMVARFYQLLFERQPAVKPMFANTSMEQQQSKLLAALVTVIDSLERPEELAGTLESLGERHKNYGAEPAHYQAVAEVLLDVMAEFGGDLWTNEVAAAWENALTQIATMMMNNDDLTEDTEMAGANSAEKGGSVDLEEAARMRAAVNGAMTAIMMIDRDLNVTYANEATIKLLREHEVALRSIYPSFNVDALVGSCIDMFHKNPAHQRQLLSNSSNLPYSSDIQVGPLTFSINVTAIYDDAGSYIGNSMEWSDVTEARKSEDQANRLQSAVDGAMTCIMMIDRDLTITYVNESTVDLLTTHQAALKSLYPSFDVKNAVGTCIDMFHANPSHQRQLLDNPNNLPYSTDIHVGPLTFRINVSSMHNLNGDYIGNTLEWSDVTEARAKEIEVSRLQSAIDGAQANIMLCNTDLEITYVNPAVVGMLSKRESVLRERFPGFDTRNLVGTCIDIFHKNPAHQRQLLSNPANLPASAEMEIAGLEFKVNATAIVDAQGNWMGNMVEWGDITEQKDAERQMENLITAASAGDLSQRIEAEKYEGFLKNLGTGINSMLDAVVAPIQEGTRVMKSLAEGTLTETMQGEYEGDFAVLRDAIDTSVNNLRNMVGDIRTAGSAITSGAGEIAQGNADLSQRTEEQASSLEETASSMEELTGTVRQNADNANQANQLASGARDQAEKGGEVVGKAVDAMGEINSSSKKIADIISVIDEIAFQTNLLALNAAVEAARAGEQGRGFAVVAGEVRNLAQRSAAAAKEIKSLINDSVEKVEEGSKLVDLSGQTLAEIVESVKKVSDIIAEIAAASQEQSSGIDQVNKAITQMDEVTQQNAALVEEAAAASESMDEQAKGLERLMNFFKTGAQDLMAGRSGASSMAAPSQPQAERPSSTSTSGTNRGVKPSADDEWEEF